MGFAVMLVYTALTLLSPADMLPVLAPYRVMLVLAIIVVACSAEAFLSSLHLLHMRQFALMVLFTGWLIASWLPHGWLRGTLMALTTFMPAGLVYFLTIIHVQSVSRIRMTRAVLVVAAVYILVMGLLEYSKAAATLTSQPYVMVQPWLGGVNLRLRGLGLLHDPNTLGNFLLMLMPLLFVQARPAGRSFVPILIAAIFLAGIFFTGSRGALLGIALLVGIYLRRKWPFLGSWMTGAFGGLVIAYVNLSSQGRSISVSGGMDRLALWSEGIGLFRSSPIWGIGFRQFTDEVSYTAHNSYLLCAAELGFVGYFFWIGTLVVTFLQLKHVSKLAAAPGASPEILELGRWATALKASLAVYLLTAYFLSLTYSVWFYLFLGLSGAVFQMATRKSLTPKEQFTPRWMPVSFAVCAASLFLIYLSVRSRAL